MNIRFTEIKGVTGSLRVGPHVAAKLLNWTLTPKDGSFTFAAELTDIDRFWITQTPRAIHLTFGQNGLVWRAADLEIADGKVMGTLPPLEAK